MKRIEEENMFAFTYRLLHERDDFIAHQIILWEEAENGEITKTARYFDGEGKEIDGDKSEAIKRPERSPFAITEGKPTIRTDVAIYPIFKDDNGNVVEISFEQFRLGEDLGALYGYITPDNVSAKRIVLVDVAKSQENERREQGLGYVSEITDDLYAISKPLAPITPGMGMPGMGMPGMGMPGMVTGGVPGMGMPEMRVEDEFLLLDPQQSKVYNMMGKENTDYGIIKDKVIINEQQGITEYQETIHLVNKHSFKFYNHLGLDDGAQSPIHYLPVTIGIKAYLIDLRTNNIMFEEGLDLSDKRISINLNRPGSALDLDPISGKVLQEGPYVAISASEQNRLYTMVMNTENGEVYSSQGIMNVITGVKLPGEELYNHFIDTEGVVRNADEGSETEYRRLIYNQIYHINTGEVYNANGKIGDFQLIRIPDKEESITKFYDIRNNEFIDLDIRREDRFQSLSINVVEDKSLLKYKDSDDNKSIYLWDAEKLKASVQYQFIIVKVLDRQGEKIDVILNQESKKLYPWNDFFGQTEIVGYVFHEESQSIIYKEKEYDLNGELTQAQIERDKEQLRQREEAERRSRMIEINLGSDGTLSIDKTTNALKGDNAENYLVLPNFHVMNKINGAIYNQSGESNDLTGIKSQNSETYNLYIDKSGNFALDNLGKPTKLRKSGSILFDMESGMFQNHEGEEIIEPEWKAFKLPGETEYSKIFNATTRQIFDYQNNKYLYIFIRQDEKVWLCNATDHIYYQLNINEYNDIDVEATEYKQITVNSHPYTYNIKTGDLYDQNFTLVQDAKVIRLDGDQNDTLVYKYRNKLHVNAIDFLSKTREDIAVGTLENEQYLLVNIDTGDIKILNAQNFELSLNDNYTSYKISSSTRYSYVIDKENRIVYKIDQRFNNINKTFDKTLFQNQDDEYRVMDTGNNHIRDLAGEIVAEKVKEGKNYKITETGKTPYYIDWNGNLISTNEYSNVGGAPKIQIEGDKVNPRLPEVIRHDGRLGVVLGKLDSASNKGGINLDSIVIEDDEYADTDSVTNVENRVEPEPEPISQAPIAQHKVIDTSFGAKDEMGEKITMDDLSPDNATKSIDDIDTKVSVVPEPEVVETAPEPEPVTVLEPAEPEVLETETAPVNNVQPNATTTDQPTAPVNNVQRTEPNVPVTDPEPVIEEEKKLSAAAIVGIVGLSVLGVGVLYSAGMFAAYAAIQSTALETLTVEGFIRFYGEMTVQIPDAIYQGISDFLQEMVAGALVLPV